MMGSCPYCGAPKQREGRFCANCGAALVASGRAVLETAPSKPGSIHRSLENLGVGWLGAKARQSHVGVGFGFRIASSWMKSTGRGGRLGFSTRRMRAWGNWRKLYNGILKM